MTEHATTAARTVRVRAVQLPAGELDVEAAVEAVVAAIGAATGLADLVVLPELATTRYDLRRHLHDVAPQPGDETFARITEAARAAGVVAVVGFAERVGDRTYNSAAVIDSDGSPAGVVRKAHLFAGERKVFAPGDAIAPVPTSIGVLGVLICFDLEIPEVARTLALAGAELLVACSANMEGYERYQEVYTRSRAMENGLPLVLSNWVGPGPRFTFLGQSTVVSAQGDVLVDAGLAVGSVDAEVALAHITAIDPELDYLAYRRPELYG
jgi:predicted amidohydrolase